MNQRAPDLIIRPQQTMLAVVLVPIRVYTLWLLVNQAAKVFTRHLVTFCIRFGSFTKCLGISPRYLWKETLVCIFQTLLWTVRRFEESSGCIYRPFITSGERRYYATRRYRSRKLRLSTSIHRLLMAPKVRHCFSHHVLHVIRVIFCKLSWPHD